jgi:hypothetical protein
VKPELVVGVAASSRQARDKRLIEDATEIRKRAERRIGELMEDQRQDGMLKQGRPKRVGTDPVHWHGRA